MTASGTASLVLCTRAASNYTDVVMSAEFVAYEGLHHHQRGEWGHVTDELGRDRWATADGNGLGYLNGDDELDPFGWAYRSDPQWHGHTIWT